MRLKYYFVIVLTFLSLVQGALAGTYSVAGISLSYGALSVGAGGGNLFATVDSQNRLSSININVSAGMFGQTYPISYSETVGRLMTGNTLNFYMDGGSQPVLKIKALDGFNVNGGKLKISTLQKTGYVSEVVELARAVKSKKFYIWKGNDIVSDIKINMRGYSISEMYVGKYEMSTN